MRGGTGEGKRAGCSDRQMDQETDGRVEAGTVGVALHSEITPKIKSSVRLNVRSDGNHHNPAVTASFLLIRQQGRAGLMQPLPLGNRETSG